MGTTWTDTTRKTGASENYIKLDSQEAKVLTLHTHTHTSLNKGTNVLISFHFKCKGTEKKSRGKGKRMEEIKPSKGSDILQVTAVLCSEVPGSPKGLDHFCVSGKVAP